ncbi:MULTISPECIES: hypothetical protein [Gemmobacter]|jgi:hypothetical protein|nr:MULTISPECIES: hypothetical protein [Gemmobacter]
MLALSGALKRDFPQNRKLSVGGVRAGVAPVPGTFADGDAGVGSGAVCIICLFFDRL